VHFTPFSTELFGEFSPLFHHNSILSNVPNDVPQLPITQDWQRHWIFQQTVPALASTNTKHSHLGSHSIWVYGIFDIDKEYKFRFTRNEDGHEITQVETCFQKIQDSGPTKIKDIRCRDLYYHG